MRGIASILGILAVACGAAAVLGVDIVSPGAPSWPVTWALLTPKAIGAVGAILSVLFGAIAVALRKRRAGALLMLIGAVGIAVQFELNATTALAIILSALAATVAGWGPFLLRRADVARVDWMRARANAVEALERTNVPGKALDLSSARIGQSGGSNADERWGSAIATALAEWAAGAATLALAYEAVAKARGAEAVSAERAAGAARLARCAWIVEVSDAATDAHSGEVWYAESAAKLNSAAKVARALAGQDLGWADDIASASGAAVKEVLRAAQVRFVVELRGDSRLDRPAYRLDVERALQSASEALEIGRALIQGDRGEASLSLHFRILDEISARAEARRLEQIRSVRISDIRLKRDVVRLGRLENGVGVYRFRYCGDDATLFVGVIAQDVERVMPGAVVRGDDGYLRVDYRRLPFRLMTWDEWRRMGRQPPDRPYLWIAAGF